MIVTLKHTSNQVFVIASGDIVSLKPGENDISDSTWRAIIDLPWGRRLRETGILCTSTSTEATLSELEEKKVRRKKTGMIGGKDE
jgi:hypothetical protein